MNQSLHEQSETSTDEEMSEAESQHSSLLPPLPSAWPSPMSLGAILNPDNDEGESQKPLLPRQLETIDEDQEDGLVESDFEEDCEVPCVFVPC